MKSAPLAPGFDGILYPGELEARYEARHAREGPELRAQAERLGLPWPPG